MVPQHPAYLLEVVDNTLPPENQFLDLLDRGVEFILHAGEVLSDEGVFVLCAHCVEVVILVLVLALEYVGEGVEALGLLGGFRESMPSLNLLLPKALEGVNLLGLLTFVPDFPKLFSRQLLIVPPRLDYFWHQQWNNYNGN